MTDYDERIEELQDEIRNTQYNKATQHHIGLLKAKIAKLKDEREKEASKGGKSEGYAVPKTGDATVTMLGFPSVGKSTLLNAITNADSEVGSYHFTTLDVIPGMMFYNGAQIQVLDVPGIVSGAASGKGRGKEVLSVIRSADLIMIVLDATNPEQVHRIREEVYDSGIRLNEEPPHVKIVKRQKGGIDISPTVQLTHVDKETLVDVAKEMGYMNADFVIREDITMDRFIDALEGNKVYTPSITVLNKADLVDDINALKKEYDAQISISAENKKNLEKLRKLIWKDLGVMRIYMKEPRKEADMDEPLIIKKGSTIEDACAKLHRDMQNRFRFARVSGPSSKFKGQKVAEDHVLKDGDVLELHLR